MEAVHVDRADLLDSLQAAALGLQWSALLSAIEDGDLAWVQCLVEEEGVSVNPTREGGPTPLAQGLVRNQPQIAHYLLEKGASPECEFLARAKWPGRWPKASELLTWTPLHGTAFSGDAKLVRALLEKGAKVDARDEDENTPLHLAAQSSVDIVECLIQNGASVQETNAFDQKPLHFAACDATNSDSLPVAKYLLDQGTDVDARDKMGRSSFHMAAASGNLEFVKYLASKGIDVNANSPVGTALHYALLFGQRSVAEFLLQVGADARAEADAGRLLPIHVATIFGELDCIKLLVEHNGVSANAPSGDPRLKVTPLIYAIENKHPAVVEYLLQAGADPNICDANEWSPFLHAVTRRLRLDDNANEKKAVFDKIIDLLLRHGADMHVSSTRQYGLDPLAFAITLNNLEIVKFLCEKGARVNVEIGETKLSPLHLAAAHGSMEMVNYLLGQGARIGKTDPTPLDIAISNDNDEVIYFLIRRQRTKCCVIL